MTRYNAPESRFLSQAECIALAERAAKLAIGGGETGVILESAWLGNIRYSRNTIMSSGDARDHSVAVIRSIHGATSSVGGNQIGMLELQAAIRRCERILKLYPETGGPPFQEHFVLPKTTVERGNDAAHEMDLSLISAVVQTPEPHATPKLFYDTTYNLDAEARAESVRPLMESARRAGMSAAGYIEVSAHGRAAIDTWGRSLYYPFTRSQYSVTVRDPKGIGSGWAGVDWGDWTRVDTARLTQIALDKCLRSRNPVAIEPGRYTTILEPQAVHGLFSIVIGSLSRLTAEQGLGPWALGEGKTKIGLRVLDDRLTVGADPNDEELGFPPFGGQSRVFHPVTWFEKGVLRALSYDRRYGIKTLGINSGLPNSYSYRMQGGTTTIDEMITTTKRGLLVTRFSNLSGAPLDSRSLLLAGYTRDGLWLIENGKISKAVKNFRFLESPLFAFNNVEQIGSPIRVFSPGTPAIVPPIKVRDFNFSHLTDAV